MLREMPSRAWKSSNRRTPKNASRTISMLHHSPTTSRHCATEQFMSSKLVRCTTSIVVSCIIERNPLPKIPMDSIDCKESMAARAEQVGDGEPAAVHDLVVRVGAGPY